MRDQTTEQGIMDGVAHTTSRTLIGRDAELTEIASLLGVRSSADAGQAAETAHVLLSGDAGVGKTRLLVELRDLAVEEGWRVVAGHCLDFGDSALPYLPFSEVLGRLEVELPEVVQRVAEAHPTLTRLQPGRRVLVSPESASAPGRVEGESLDRSDLFTRRALAARGGGGRGAGAAGHRGLPLGRPVDPRPAELPLLPALRGPGGDRGVVPLRRPAPPPPAPPPGRRVVAAERRRADAAGQAARRARPAADRQPVDARR